MEGAKRNRYTNRYPFIRRFTYSAEELGAGSVEPKYRGKEPNAVEYIVDSVTGKPFLIVMHQPTLEQPESITYYMLRCGASENKETIKAIVSSHIGLIL